ncbi:BamA/TamA family outer membrane protein [Candidatus Babeliales bacterium]|nr:BamA/TamA family outer membrane protein [Candidatus Babeliales bacterium]
MKNNEILFLLSFLKYTIILILFFVFFKASTKGYSGSFADLVEMENIQTDDSFYLDKLTFESDVPFSKIEFLYLTDLSEGSNVTLKGIEKAYENFTYKKRFKNVEIDVEIDDLKINLHFKLKANWIFKKLIIRGIWFDKHEYSSLYKQQEGDIFDIVFHEKSIGDIKDFLYHRGYFDCDIQDELIYKKIDKSIIAILYIKKKRGFYINKVEFKLMSRKEDDQDILKEEFSIFQNKLEKKIGFDLLDFNYLKPFIEKQVGKIKKFFRKRGFLECFVSVKRIVDRINFTVQITFIIKLGKRRILKFEGNRLFSEKQVMKDLLGIDYPSWIFSAQIIAEQLVHEYYKKGYWNVLIKARKDNGDTFLFRINEGEPIIVDQIIIKDKVNDQMIGNEDFFKDLFKTRIFDENLLDNGIERLKESYLKNGFWDFSILDKKFIKSNMGKRCKIILLVRKGMKRFCGGISIEGYKDSKIQDFFSKFDLHKDEFKAPFNFYWFQEQKSFLLNYFYKKGYWKVDIKPEFVTSPIFKSDNYDEGKKNCCGQLVFVNWKVKIGSQVKFGKVFVHGDTTVPFSRILKQLNFRQGDIWNRNKIESSRKNLKKLDVFKHIQIHPYKLLKDKKNIEQPVILNLIDDDPLHARIRVGYFLTSKNFLFERASTYKLGTSLIIKNPTNSADKLMFNADFTRFERKINLDYRIPDPFSISLKNSSLIGKIRVYTNKYVHPVEILRSGSAYEAVQNGFLFGLNNEYKQGYFWGLSLGNEWLKTSRVRGDLKIDQSIVGKTIPFLFIEPSIIIDKLDNRLDVTKGSVNFFSLKFMIPERISSVICKLMFEQSVFYPIFKNVIGCARIRFGHIFRSSFDQIQPVERFYLGGPYSVRGYEKDSLPPLGVDEIIRDDGTIEKIYTIQGGSGMINGNIEIRFPIYKSFRGVIFQDVGVLSQTGFGGFKGKLYPATGFGFRYKTPLGPLRFDIGWKWRRRLKDDSSYAWYLTLGEAF